jgi:hypothetical protein
MVNLGNVARRIFIIGTLRNAGMLGRNMKVMKRAYQHLALLKNFEVSSMIKEYCGNIWTSACLVITT